MIDACLLPQGSALENGTVSSASQSRIKSAAAPPMPFLPPSGQRQTPTAPRRYDTTYFSSAASCRWARILLCCFHQHEQAGSGCAQQRIGMLRNIYPDRDPRHSQPLSVLHAQAPMTEAEQAAAAEDEAAAAAIARGAWAFQQLADDLCYDALDPAWHVRHGAALALREILRSQAAAAGIEAPLASEPSGRRPKSAHVRLCWLIAAVKAW